tara:strand:+ start:296 stop:562 length:267 start_codon:yes stop_codon:yes gene_type:complete
MSTKAKQQLPKWFNGQLYEEGDIVENPYSGESIELNNIELSMYDFVMGATMVYEMGGLSTNGKLLKELQDGLRWFRINNPKAYMVLLD